MKMATLNTVNWPFGLLRLPEGDSTVAQPLLSSSSCSRTVLFAPGVPCLHGLQGDGAARLCVTL